MANSKGTAAKSPCKGKTGLRRCQPCVIHPITDGHLKLTRIFAIHAWSAALGVTSLILQSSTTWPLGPPENATPYWPRKLCSRQEPAYILPGFSDLKAQTQYGYAAKFRKSSTRVRSRGHAQSPAGECEGDGEGG